MSKRITKLLDFLHRYWLTERAKANGIINILFRSTEFCGNFRDVSSSCPEISGIFRKLSLEREKKRERERSCPNIFEVMGYDAIWIQVIMHYSSEIFWSYGREV